MLIIRGPRFAPDSPRGRELDRSTADRAWVSFWGLLIRIRRRGGGGELPFYESKVLMDGVGEGSTGSYGGSCQAWCPECGLGRGREIEGRRYMAV